MLYLLSYFRFSIKVMCHKTKVGAKEHPFNGGGRNLMNIVFLKYCCLVENGCCLAKKG